MKKIISFDFFIGFSWLGTFFQRKRDTSLKNSSSSNDCSSTQQQRNKQRQVLLSSTTIVAATAETQHAAPAPCRNGVY